MLHLLVFRWSAYINLRQYSEVFLLWLACRALQRLCLMGTGNLKGVQ